MGKEKVVDSCESNVKLSTVILAIVLALVLYPLVGCSGRLYVGFDRTDEVEIRQVMKDKPWWNVFYDGGKEGK